MTVPEVAPITAGARRWPVLTAVFALALGLGAGSIYLMNDRDERSPVTGLVEVRSAVVGATRAPAAAAYMTLSTRATDADRLVGVSSPVAAAVSIHVTDRTDGLAIMEQVDHLDVPPGEGVLMAPGATHLMLEDLRAPLQSGSVVPLQLRFERAGDVQVQAEVVPLEELADRVGR